MDFAFSPEQQELGAVVRRLLAAACPETELHRRIADGPASDRAAWSRLATEVGVPALAVPEEHGGAGFGIADLGVVFVELGRTLALGPYLSSTALATAALTALAGTQLAAELLPDLAAGGIAGALAVCEDDGSWDLAGTGTTASAAGDGWELRGTKSFVVDGAQADVVLVSALAGEDPGLFTLRPRDAAGSLLIEQLDTLDPTRPQARLTLDGTPARRIASGEQAVVAVERARLVGSALLAAEQFGIADRVLSSTVEYAGARRQFGRAIGSFQAVKHQCADMLLALEGARSASLYALWAADHAPHLLAEAATIAATVCGDAALLCAERGVQLHGGIGFTWEHPAHLFLRRARSARELLGSPRARRAELAVAAGL